MAHRIAAAILLVFCATCLSHAETLQVKNVGIRDFESYLYRDFSINRDVEDFFLSGDEDSLSFMLYQSIRFEHKLPELKKIVDTIKNERIREKLISDMYFVAKNSKQLSEYRELFEDQILKKKRELPILLLSLNDNTLEKTVFTKEKYIAFKKSYLEYKQGKYVSALLSIAPFKNDFPHTYFIYLVEKGDYADAYGFISTAPVDDRRHLMALCRYLLRDYKGVIELLNKPDLSYEERTLSIDAKLKLGMENDMQNEMKTAVLPDFVDDDLWIFKAFRDLSISPEETVYRVYQGFHYRWQLRNFFNYLTLYQEEIQSFQKRAKSAAVNFKTLKEEYERIWEKVKDRKDAKDLRDRYLSMIGTMSGMKYTEIATGPKKTFHEYFENQLKASRKVLRDEYEIYRNKIESSAEKLQKEIEFRKRERVLKGIATMTDEDMLKLVHEFRMFSLQAMKRRLSFEEAAMYYQVYLLWEYYLRFGEKVIENRDKVLQNVKEAATAYLSRYTERRLDVLLVLAETLDSLGDTQRAYETLKQYFSLNPRADARAFMKMGEILFDRREYVEAIIYFKRSIDRSAVYKNAAYYKIGWSYYLMGRYAEVADLFMSYNFENFTGKGESLLDEMMDLLSRTFFKMGDEAFMDKYLKRYPRFSYPDKLFKAMGDIYLFMADYTTAMHYYEKGLAGYYLYEFSPDLLSSKVETLALMGKESDLNNEKLRFSEQYGRKSGYYKKFNRFPKNYKEYVLSAGYYYNAVYDRDKNPQMLASALLLYGIFLNEFAADARAGEVAFLVAQMNEEAKAYAKADEYYEKARTLGFRAEESMYRGIFCKHRLWLEKKMSYEALMQAMTAYVKKYPNSEKILSVYMVMADINLKEKREPDMFVNLEDAAAIPQGKGVKKALDFLETNFEQVGDKRRASMLFDKGWQMLRDKRYLELKHYALFTLAKRQEDQNDNTAAKMTYGDIIRDADVSMFKGFATYNLALVLQKEGDLKSSLEIMKKVGDAKDLGNKAKNFVYVFGKQSGMYQSSAEAAEDLARDNSAERSKYLLEAAWLYQKAGNTKASERVTAMLAKQQLSADEQAQYAMIQGTLAYKKGDNEEAYRQFTRVFGKPVPAEWEDDLMRYFPEVLKKTIYVLPEDEARNVLESFIDHVSGRFKAKGDPQYLYYIGGTLADFSVFFIQKDVALAKAADILKKALAASVEKKDADLTAKIMARLKDVNPEVYGREFQMPFGEYSIERILKSDEKILN